MQLLIHSQKEKLAHSEKLIKDVFEPIINETIDYGNYQIGFTPLSWIKLSDIRNSKYHAIEHLRKGYFDTWKLLIECNVHRDNILECYNYIKTNIRNKLEPDVPPFGFGHNFTVENIEMMIYKEIETILKKGYVPEKYTAHLTLFGFHVEDHNEKYLVDKKELFRKRIESIIKDETLYEKFRTLNQEKELLDKKSNKFIYFIKNIKYDFDSKHIALKATCSDCKGKGWWLLWGT